MRRSLILLALLCIVTGCGGRTLDDPAAIAQVSSATTISPSSTPKPSTTPASSATTAPSAIPKPTRTATSVPTETPIPTPVPPIDLTGKGQKVTDPVTLPYSVSRVHLSHSGQSNFIVKAYDAAGEETYLVNAIGKYTGVQLLVSNEPVYFEIDADGTWELHVEAIPGEPSATTLAGHGDYTSGVFEPPRIGPVPYAFTHTGESNFIVHLYCGGGEDYVQNEIGAVESEAVVRFEDGPCLWGIKADGDWTITPK